MPPILPFCLIPFSLPSCRNIYGFHFNPSTLSAFLAVSLSALMSTFYSPWLFNYLFICLTASLLFSLPHRLSFYLPHCFIYILPGSLITSLVALLPPVFLSNLSGSLTGSLFAPLSSFYSAWTLSYIYMCLIFSLSSRLPGYLTVSLFALRIQSVFSESLAP